MDNKYYTPEISEFYVGFEFEIASYGGKMLPGSPTIKEWIQDKLTSDLYDINYILDIYNEGKQCTDIRVKYLDSSDIEELGFIFEEQVVGKITFKYTKNNFIELHKLYTTILILNNGRTIFEGFIKNKSELIRLLGWLNV